MGRTNITAAGRDALGRAFYAAFLAKMKESIIRYSPGRNNGNLRIHYKITFSN